MTTRKSTAALNKAAQIIATALSVDVSKVQREQLGPQEGDLDVGTKTRLVLALSEGSTQETNYLMGATEPFEMTHDGAFEVLVVGGSEADRRIRRESAIVLAAQAIQANPTLDGLVIWAELADPDPDAAHHYLEIAATLRLTYSAPTALG